MGTIALGRPFEAASVKECRVGGIGNCDAVVVSQSFFDDSNDAIMELRTVAFGIGEYVKCVVGVTMNKASSQCSFDFGGFVRIVTWGYGKSKTYLWPR